MTKRQALGVVLTGLLCCLPILAALYSTPVQASPPFDTYVASVSGQATTASMVLSIEAPAATGFRLTGYCVVTSNATAAGPVTITVQRRTTASSGGTALTNEGTGATAVSKLVRTSVNFPGIARLGGTPGTAGAVFDQQAIQVGVVTAGPGPMPVCRFFGVDEEALPTVAPGVANGISITVSAAGAGGLAVGMITATVAIGE
jgi:hypothetical protein